MERLNRRHGYLRMSKTYYKAIVISTTRNLHTGRYVWYRHRHRWMKQNITQRSKPSHTAKSFYKDIKIQIFNKWCWENEYPQKNEIEPLPNTTQISLTWIKHLQADLNLWNLKHRVKALQYWIWWLLKCNKNKILNM